MPEKFSFTVDHMVRKTGIQASNHVLKIARQDNWGIRLQSHEHNLEPEHPVVVQIPHRPDRVGYASGIAGVILIAKYPRYRLAVA